MNNKKYSLKSAIRKAIRANSNYIVEYIMIDMPEKSDYIGQMLINITTRKKKVIRKK